MLERIRGRGVGLAGLAAVCAVVAAVGACGSSSGSGSGDAKSLLQQTFSGSHPVKSGDLDLQLTIHPSGSTTFTTPFTLSFGGPFEAVGSGKLPKSNFSVTLSGAGKSTTLGLLSTGTSGYVTLQGMSYALPAATFKKLESSFAGLSSSAGAGTGGGALAKLGIHPLDWLSNPSVVGEETMDGTATTHIRATINVAALLGDLNTFLAKTSSAGVSSKQIPTSISAATRQKIAREVKSPTFDLWTGKSDQTLRKMVIDLTVPVSGQTQTELGGLRSAQIGLTMQYSALNQPQTISAPTSVRPFSEFQTKLRSVLGSTSIAGLTGATASGSASAGSASASTGSGSASTGSGSASPAGSATARWSQCIAQAHRDVAKMQKCASLLNGQ